MWRAFIWRWEPGSNPFGSKGVSPFSKDDLSFSVGNKCQAHDVLDRISTRKKPTDLGEQFIQAAIAFKPSDWTSDARMRLATELQIELCVGIQKSQKQRGSQ